MKKSSSAIIIFLILLIITTAVIINNNSNVEKNTGNLNVTICVYDNDNAIMFDKSVETKREYLIDVLNDISELELVTVHSEYGAYITSVMGIEQNEQYYWSYYIGEEYATVGITNCKIEDKKTYNLKLEELNY